MIYEIPLKRYATQNFNLRRCMYKSKEKQKEATKERVRRYREKQKGVTKLEGVTTANYDGDATTDSTYFHGEEGKDWDYTNTPAIVKALTDPKKRAMLEFISQDLKRKHLGDQLRYGIYGPDFEVIGELLECTA